VADDEDVLRNPLSVEDDEYDIVHEAALVGVLTVPSLEAARATARQLVEHGLGATVAELGEPAGYEVRVLPEEATRAHVLLDISEPPGAGPAGDAGAGEAGEAGEARPAATAGVGAGASPAVPGKEPVPWKKLALIWVAAMILLPLVAGLATFLLSR
jgi:hypothetical protein